MEWTQVTIKTNPGALDALCARLIALGVPGLEVEDGEDFAQLLDGRGAYWDYIDDALLAQKPGACAVKLYFPNDAALPDTLGMLRQGMRALRRDCPELDLGALALEIAGRDEKEWENAWKRYYKPVNVGERLFIRPEWEKAVCPVGRVAFVSDPGMAFGTGTHASTRLCLEMLEKKVRGGERLLDIGCGSGILAVCGLLLGCSEATGVDIDPNAVRVSEENARRNGVSARYRAFAGDVLSDQALKARISGRYEIITANIVADVIMALTPYAAGLLKPNGAYIVSGVIQERKDEVARAVCACGLALIETRCADGWCALTFTGGAHENG